MKKVFLLIFLVIFSLKSYSQIDDCETACINGVKQTYTKKISYPLFGVKANDFIEYKFTYKICNGVMYIQTMEWNAKYNDFLNAYNVRSFSRVNDILNIIWKDIPTTNSVAFPASCFRTVLLRNVNVYEEGIRRNTDYTSVAYCDPGCCIFNKGEILDLTTDRTDDEATCQSGCQPFCRGYGK